MRVLFANRILFDDSTRGGAQQSTRDLCRALARRGIESAILGSLATPAHAPIKVTRVDGIEQVCSSDVNSLFPYYLDRFKPDLVVLSSGDIRAMIRTCLARGIPTILYWLGVQFHVTEWTIPRSPRISYLANSPFIARMLRATFGLPVTVIPSLVMRSRYLTTSSRERVVFVNPHPMKGSHLAFALARARPSIPFTFVEGWKLPESEERWLRQACAQAANVDLHPRVDDMREIYRFAKVLLAPSACEEGEGRVVTEAQVNGIPVLGSNRGALPESIGAGGIVEDLFAPVERWAAHLDRLWTDSSYYDQLSQAARMHAARPEISEEGVADAFLVHVERFLADQRRRHPVAPRAPALIEGDTGPKGPPKVFGIGLSRTGTSTLTRALEILGLRPIHYPTSIDQVRAHGAAADLPVAGSFERLDALFPRSRFIYTFRPLDAWLESCKMHFSRDRAIASAFAIRRFALYGCVDYDRDAFVRAYAAHEERVRAYFKDRPEDLLSIDLTMPGDHWQALCAFLGRPRPATEFPWLNRFSHCEALVRRLHGAFGDVDQAASVLAVNRDWVASVVRDGGETMIAESALTDDEGKEFSHLMKRIATHFGGVEAAAERLGVPDKLVQGAVERVRERRDQLGTAG